jgi:hypothetical protein
MFLQTAYKVHNTKHATTPYYEMWLSYKNNNMVFQLIPWSRFPLQTLSLSYPKNIRLYGNPKVHYRFHNSQPFLPVFNRINPFHNFLPCISNIHYNIVLPFTPRSSKWSLPFGFSDQNFVCALHGQPFHHPWFYHNNHNRWIVQDMKLHIMQSSSDFCHFLPLRSKYPPPMFLP